MEKIIVGTDHANQRELARVYDMVRERNPLTLGLELPANFKELEAWGIITDFFGDLTVQLAREGYDKIIPLEDSRLHHDEAAMSIALDVRVNKKDPEYVLREAQMYRDLIGQPGVSLEAGTIMAGHYESAYELLKRFPEAEDLFEFRSENHVRRERVMLDTILRTSPEMCIVGIRHAEKLRLELPDYTFIKLE